MRKFIFRLPFSSFISENPAYWKDTAAQGNPNEKWQITDGKWK